ncbi:MAG: RdgB/HAM1 family non-canonical purine NTP pyrophosphatase [Opitutaceae bacterium]|nr:RdgB/HAM1 family non-canonical purine NTP pyrophosphatase [Opitutaceae bacterium]
MPPFEFCLASGNAHKVAELQGLAAASGLAVRIRSAREFGGMPPVDEDTGTFVGNARKKALALRATLPPAVWALADDSGVCVDALGGAPGVESAYYAGPQHDAAANLAKLVAVMRGVPEAKRGARFVCVLLALGPRGEERIFEGECHGRLLGTPRGGGGFGYDPIFLPEGFSASYAEISDAEKNQISHRARAWGRLADWVRGGLKDVSAPARR